MHCGWNIPQELGIAAMAAAAAIYVNIFNKISISSKMLKISISFKIFNKI